MPVPDPLEAEPLALPRQPPPPPKSGFPLLAVLAPLVGAAILFAVVRSPYMLAFAALSPVIAVAGVVDGRISARRRRRADERTFAAEAARYREDVAVAHERERRMRDQQHPAASSLVSDAEHRPRRWAHGDDDFAAVRIGTGRTTSALTVSGSAASERDRELLVAARTIADVPIVADPSDGIGLIGLPPVARAALRGLVVQLAHSHPPGAMAIVAPPDEAYDWLDDYPHGASPQHEPLVLRILDDTGDGARGEAPAGQVTAATPVGRGGASARSATLAVAERVDELPAGCRLVAEVSADGRLTVLAPAHAVGELRTELVTAQTAAAFGRELAASARTRGVDLGRPLPPTVRFAELPAVEPANGTGLMAVVGRTASGTLQLDLVASGPHAIVTGTTGSGKSELLITWVLAMAAIAAPDAVNFLLVDFKGGTAFRRLAALPHTVGVVTDLAHGEAARALKSLRAELRRREAKLADLAASDIAEASGALPRLVIVVDEAAAMLAAFPELSELFSDIAARGRALGVHLILGTQRATGVLSDALLANCALRVSLRVASDSDSTALLGTDAAARLPHGVPGRLVVARDGDLLIAQAATVESADVEAVVRAHSSASRQRAPWLPALPDVIPLRAFGAPPAGAVVIGAGDDPDRQVQEGVVYRPARAHLLVLGVRGSGKSTVLATISSQWTGSVIAVPAGIEGAWDAMTRAESLLHSRQDDDRGCLVLIDDVDALLDRFDDEHRDAMAERIRSLLVDGPRAGIAVECTAAMLPTGLRSVAGRFGERLLLRQADKQEHVLSGAPADLYDPSAPPGRGVWHERAVQVAMTDVPAPESEPSSASRRPPVLTFPPASLTLVVTRSPGALVRRLRVVFAELDVVDLGEVGTGLGRTSPESLVPAPEPGSVSVTEDGRAVVVVGDADVWQANWTLLGRLRQRSTLVFDGCTLAQVRAILHARVLPPPAQAGHVIVCDSSMEFTRATLPA
jgi:S-DNA-T family DNA segregation ATPase FtsK/SpoIIIE